MAWYDAKPMSGDEYSKALKSLGFTHVSAGKFLDFSERQSRRYAQDRSRVPRTVAMALRALLLFRVQLPRH